MNKYNFDQIVNRRNTSSVKWDVEENELPMWVADMDFSVCPKIIESIKKRADVSAYGYVDVPDEYFESYVKWWKNRHDVDIKKEDLIYCTGVISALDSIFKHILPKDSGVILQTPVYHTFFNCVRNNGLEIIPNHLKFENNNYYIDFKKLEEQIALEHVKALVLCNPHNPIGKIWGIDDLKRVSSLCEKYDVLLISDEIHCDISEPGYKYNSIFKVTNNAVALLSPTKAFNLAGIQMACIACPNQELKKAIQAGVYQDDVGEPNYFSACAAISAYNECEDWLDEMNEYVFNNKKYFVEFVNKELPQIKVIDNKATYLLWVDISNISSGSKQFASDLRKKTGLFVSPGSQFGEGGEGHLRINIATSLDNVKEACKRLKEYIG